MPIVGSVPDVSWNVSDYSHSTVFTTTLASALIHNVPPLLKIYTPNSECVDRWMLADNTLGTNFFTQTRTLPATVVVTTAMVGLSIRSSLPDVTPPVGGIYRRAEPDLGRVFNLTVWSIDDNPLFSSCQPYSLVPLYSPGVCPNGQTAAEVTKFVATQTDGIIRTSWVASCCKRCVFALLICGLC